MNNPPAFPVTTGSDGGCLNEGMTLRDYFAAAALTGMWSDQAPSPTYADLAKFAYMQADAMLKAREQ